MVESRRADWLFFSLRTLTVFGSLGWHWFQPMPRPLLITGLLSTGILAVTTAVFIVTATERPAQLRQTLLWIAPFDWMVAACLVFCDKSDGGVFFHVHYLFVAFYSFYFGVTGGVLFATVSTLTQAFVATLNGSLGHQNGQIFQAAFLWVIAVGVGAVASPLVSAHKELEGLFALSKEIISHPNRRDIANLIVEEAALVIPGGSVALLLRDDDSQSLITQAVHGFDGAGPPCRPHICRCRLCQQTIDEQRPRILTDHKWRSCDAVDCSTSKLYRAAVSVPLIHEGTVVGLLNIYCDHPHRFTHHEIDLLTAVASLAAMGIQNLRLSARARLIPELHHRMKNNLQQVANLLSMQARRTTHPEVADGLGDAITRIKSMSVVHQLLARTDREQVPVNELIQKVGEISSATLLPDLSRFRFTVTGKELLVSVRVASSLGIIANELVTNAILHGVTPQRPLDVRVGIAEEDGDVIIRVDDNGAGLPHGFDADASAHLGITIVRTLVERDFGGSIDFFSREGGGTAVVIRIARHGFLTAPPLGEATASVSQTARGELAEIGRQT